MNAAKCTEGPAPPDTDSPRTPKRRRRWGALALRVAHLARRQVRDTADLVTQSYNRIATGYDTAWTKHMRDLSQAMLERLFQEKGGWRKWGLAPERLVRRSLGEGGSGGACTHFRAGYDRKKGDRHLRGGRKDLSRTGRHAPEPVPLFPDAHCIDLACGTGFVTSRLAEIVGGRPTGVDASDGMLAQARANHGDRCDFVCADALEFLRNQESASADVITCAWALGYGRPLAVVRQAARVLRPGGRLGIIDNTLLSLAGVLRAAVATFAEYPEALDHVMRVRFLPHSAALATMMRWAGLAVQHCADGSRTYLCPDGAAAIARLRATGAAAGFEFAAAPAAEQAVFARFAEIIEDLYATDRGVPITHRYLVCIGSTPQ